LRLLAFTFRSLGCLLCRETVGSIGFGVAIFAHQNIYWLLYGSFWVFNLYQRLLNLFLCVSNATKNQRGFDCNLTAI
jgi:hypothetical protein